MQSEISEKTQEKVTGNVGMIPEGYTPFTCRECGKLHGFTDRRELRMNGGISVFTLKITWTCECGRVLQWKPLIKKISQ